MSPVGSEHDHVSVEVVDAVDVVVGAFVDTEAVEAAERCLPTPKGALLPLYLIKLSKINLPMNKHIPAG